MIDWVIKYDCQSPSLHSSRYVLRMRTENQIAIPVHDVISVEYERFFSRSIHMMTILVW